MRSIVVGDIHGCLEEFDELLKMLEYRKYHDQLILLGDLVDRGPDPVGVVRRAREIGALPIMGNHEENHLRYRKHELKKLLKPEGTYENPMSPYTEQRLKEHQAFSEDDWEYMKRMPYSRQITGNWYAVHAGLLPGLPFGDQPPTALLRMRYVNNETKKMASLEEIDSLGQGKVTFWTRLWEGPENIVYGHHVVREPCMSISVPGVFCVGLDTGCCFGGSLSAGIFWEEKLAYTVGIPAKKEYVPYQHWRE